ncbi:MAG: DegT/DnrJ/EryC1/StrS aminotransferase family protein [Gemmatimonadetes bacterium]|nr:DegT/DnrJ/EryC1/StrS aminotransferase family protein [Gemmatimonadota bacterium]
MGRTSFLPFARPDISEAEIEAVVAVLRSGWLTTGPETKAFEQEFARYIGVEHAVALNSCTAALHLALEAFGVGPGDEVLTSTMTFTATAEVVEYLGARTRFVDVDRDTLNLSAERLGELVSREYVRRNGEWRHRESGGRLRGLVPVHFGGHPCDLGALLDFAREHELVVVDDAAHALPASIEGRRVGAWDCASAFSFYATKTMTTGEGGMFCTNDEGLASRVRMMGLHGISRDAWKRYAADGSWHYEVVEAGYKYNLTDIAAALGRVQLRRLESMLERREAVAGGYDVGFRLIPEVETPQAQPGVKPAWHLYPIRLRLEQLQIDRRQFIAELHRRGIGTSVHFIPLHSQPFYAKRYGYDPGDFPVAEAEYPRLVSLPIYSGMTEADVDSVIGVVGEVVECFRA